MSNSLDLATIILPEDIKLKLEALDDVKLFTLNSDTYIDFDDDVQIDLNKIFDIHSQVEYINVIFERIIAQVFGGHEIIIINPKCKIYKKDQKIEIYLQGLLNKQKIELVFSNKPTLKYQLNHGFSFSNLTNAVPIISNLNLDEAELIISNNNHNYLHKELGNINLNKGLNFIGNINLQTISKNLSKFIYEYLQIRDLAGLISINSTGEICLISNIKGQRNLFYQPPLQADFNNLLLELNIDSDLQPRFGLTGNLTLQGYDPSQENEPKLFLAGNLSLEPESLTAYFCQQGEKTWHNPYGLNGTELRNLRFQGGGTYLPPYFDNFGFIGDLRWEEIDIEVAFLIDTNDPQRLALVLTVNQPVSLIDLWQGPVTSFIEKQAGFSTDLVNKALSLLETLDNLQIESVDADADGECNPLIKYVPFPTIIAGQPISEGLEINGKINAWGHEAILLLQGNISLNNISGSLKVFEIDLGFAKITGADDDSLDLALKVTPTEQYLQGDGYVELLGNEIANVEFKITATNAIFKNFDLNLANLISLDVDDLIIDIKTGCGSGCGKISLLGNTLAGITFDINQTSININNLEINLLGFLSLNIPLLTVNLNQQIATGEADITAFNQALGKGKLLFNVQDVFIKDVFLNLVNILKLNVPKLKVDLTKRKVSGLGNITILGKKFTELGIILNERGLKAKNDFDFGILAFNGATVTLGKDNQGNINNSASIVGNLNFLGYNIANINAKVNSEKLTASGSFNFGDILILKGMNNQKKATLILKKSKNGRYNSVSIMGRFYLLNQELTSVKISQNNGNIKILGMSVNVKN
ncbi:hypothetical protein [Sphaerospermopsis sp. LEGE 08334]|uniref:hypothetical protein n=1 Tax=Sphaerospermopsis sp. LEGE 08334 TaxID=1828651 RepID=UPI001882D6B7|nr:hypothetical protein [Sphaerospermopsis sp. LEGE 08334]MBE9057061.1 hypothetical protein [Sphaerospermopsis sp. LEGE 08334]